MFEKMFLLLPLLAVLAVVLSGSQQMVHPHSTSDSWVSADLAGSIQDQTSGD